MQTAEGLSPTTVVIDPEGDIVLLVSDPAYPLLTAAYRVSTTRLSSSSPYFRTLLEPNKFAEGINLEAQFEQLAEKYGRPKDAPEAELPIIRLENIGRIGKIKEFRGLVTDFLRILHGLGPSHGISKSHHAVPLANLANLAIVADRFDAIDALKVYSRKHNVFVGTQRRKSVAVVETWNEERCRMRLLVAVLLGHPPWFQDSLQLILKGSSQWREASNDPTCQALWWDLPCGFEEELMFRRETVISSLSSLITHFLSLYTTGGLQCKMGYSNSMNCDLFQLGQTVKFCNKLGLLHLESTMAGMDGRDPFDGDLQKALDVLKTCPSYQIDKFHAHCGLRDRLMRLLQVIQATLTDVIVCGDCWESDKHKTTWKNAKRPVIATLLAPGKVPECHNAHSKTRDFYLANNKDWKDSN